VSDRNQPDGRTALVIGASGAIGAATVGRLAADARYATVIDVSRRSSTGFDVTDEASIKRLAEAYRAAGTSFDLVFVASGILRAGDADPEKSLRHLDPAAMAQAFAVNAVGPALLLKHLGPLLARDRRAVFATVSARIGSIADNALGGWVSYRASKAALNQIVRTYSIELARTHPQAVCVALHPGTVDSALSRPYARGRFSFSADESARRMLQVIDGLSAADTGGLFAYDGARIPW